MYSWHIFRGLLKRKAVYLHVKVWNLANSDQGRKFLLTKNFRLLHNSKSAGLDQRGDDLLHALNGTEFRNFIKGVYRRSIDQLKCRGTQRPGGLRKTSLVSIIYKFNKIMVNSMIVGFRVKSERKFINHCVLYRFQRFQLLFQDNKINRERFYRHKKVTFVPNLGANYKKL